MLSKIIVTICLFVLTTNGFAQNQIKFQNRPLMRVLKKNGITNFSNLKELSLNHNTPMGKFFQVQSDYIQFKYIYIGRVNSCRAGGCSAPSANQHNLTSEYFDYYILFNSKKAISTVKVFNYQATHGHEITAKGWLKQFIGYSGTQQLQVDKQVDSISGATISVHAITNDIAVQTQKLNKL